MTPNDLLKLPYPAFKKEVSLYRTTDTTERDLEAIYSRLAKLEAKAKSPGKPETKWLVITIVSVILAGVAFDQKHLPIGGAFVCVAAICAIIAIAVLQERLDKERP